MGEPDSKQRLELGEDGAGSAADQAKAKVTRVLMSRWT